MRQSRWISNARVVKVLAPNMSLVFPTSVNQARHPSIPTTPPISENMTDSIRNPRRIWRPEKPIVRSMAISRVRPATEEYIVFAMAKTAASDMMATNPPANTRYAPINVDCPRQ